MLLLGWPVARKVNSEIDNLSNKMPSARAGALQLLPLIKFFSFLFSEFMICTQQYLLERPLKIDNSINKHINYYRPKNVSSFFLYFYSLKVSKRMCWKCFSAETTATHIKKLISKFLFLFSRLRERSFPVGIYKGNI